MEHKWSPRSQQDHNSPKRHLRRCQWPSAAAKPNVFHRSALPSGIRGRKDPCRILGHTACGNRIQTFHMFKYWHLWSRTYTSMLCNSGCGGKLVFWGVSLLHTPKATAETSCFARCFSFLALVKEGSSTSVQTPSLKTRIKDEFATGFVKESASCASLWTHLVRVLAFSNLWKILNISNTLYFSFKPKPLEFWGPFWITSKRDRASVTITPRHRGRMLTGSRRGGSTPMSSSHCKRTYISSSSAME